MWHTNNVRKEMLNVSMIISIFKMGMVWEMRAQQYLFIHFISKVEHVPLIPLYRLVPMGFRHEVNLFQPHDHYCEEGKIGCEQQFRNTIYAQINNVFNPNGYHRKVGDNSERFLWFSLIDYQLPVGKTDAKQSKLLYEFQTKRIDW